MSPESGETNWASVLKALLWPAVIAGSLIYFGRSIDAILQVLPRVISSAEVIDIGGLKVHASKDRDLPQPSDETAATVRKMTKTDIEVLAKLGTHGHYCDIGDTVPDQLNKLIGLGLATHHTSGGSKGCEKYTKLSEHGIKVQGYLFALLFSQFEKK